MANYLMKPAAALGLILSAAGGIGAIATTGAARAAPVSPAAAVSVADASLIRRGEYLARAGDCVACHSAPGKPAYSGGLAIDSGHGLIYPTNITPDRRHGIGNYTEQQFGAAVRHGKRADGTYLYPAMPYPSYTKVSDADIHALYAYFMGGVKPVAASVPAASMHFPFNLRWGMAVWNFLFASNQPFRAQPGATEQIRKGAYLVEGLGHCGSCHTPRGYAMNEKALDSGEDRFLAGGELNGWAVPSLRGLPRWSGQDIVDYLQTGRNKNASVAGEMTAVVGHSTSHLRDEDVQAIAAALKALKPVPDRAGAVTPQGSAETIRKLTAAKGLTLGERLYLDNCAACHLVTGRGASRIFPELDGATVVNADNPTALIHVILAGARTPSTGKAPSVLVMPGFGYRLSDTEAAVLATFLRQGWGNRAAAVTEADVGKVRSRLGG